MLTYYCNSWAQTHLRDLHRVCATQVYHLLLLLLLLLLYFHAHAL